MPNHEGFLEKKGSVPLTTGHTSAAAADDVPFPAHAQPARLPSLACSVARRC